MYLFTTRPHPRGHLQLQELLRNHPETYLRKITLTTVNCYFGSDHSVITWLAAASMARTLPLDRLKPIASSVAVLAEISITSTQNDSYFYYEKTYL